MFNEKIVPTSAKFGVTVVGAWVNRPQNEFIWVRTYATDETLKTYEESAERATYTRQPGPHIAKDGELRQVGTDSALHKGMLGPYEGRGSDEYQQPLAFRRWRSTHLVRAKSGAHWCGRRLPQRLPRHKGEWKYDLPMILGHEAAAWSKRLVQTSAACSRAITPCCRSRPACGVCRPGPGSRGAV
jgi:hypothetical protein